MTTAAPLIDYIQTSLPLAMPLSEQNRADQYRPDYKRTGQSRERHWNRGRWSPSHSPLPEPSPSLSPPPSQMIKSVVDEAGLGNFVYLQGASGRRYVFSSIRPEQALLYEHALFAMAPWSDEDRDVRIAESFAQLGTVAGALYVHLLDDDDQFSSETLDDLCGRG